MNERIIAGRTSRAKSRRIRPRSQITKAIWNLKFSISNLALRVLSRFLYQLPQSLQQLRSLLLQLHKAVLHHPVQGFLTFLGEREKDGTPVFLGSLPPDESPLYQPGREFHGAMVLQLELLRDLLDAGLLLGRKPANREQELVLLGFQAGLLGYFPPATQKSGELVAELRQGLVLGCRNNLRSLLPA